MLKVIIADDERLICRLVQTLADWDSLGMEVVAMAENGLEALELVQSRHPDILITDIQTQKISKPFSESSGFTGHTKQKRFGYFLI